MPTTQQIDALRRLPQVEELLHHPAVVALLNVFPRDLVVDLVRTSIEATRADILSGDLAPFDDDDIATFALKHLLKLEKPSLRRVVNASGVIVHTNLGRSALAPAAVKAVEAVAGGYSTLEYNCQTMSRGSRHNHYESLICTVTGAEAAIAVNNNAAAVMMVLSEFAGGHDALISRGELVEIGGSFRVPDIMALSGAHMVEVGTTNKTHAFDYEDNLTPDTSMLLKVHPSNYRMTGFTESVSVDELKRIAQRCGARREEAGAGAAPLVYLDLGSGALVDIGMGDFRETTVSEAHAQGADLVSFSCDKLLGGPQAGIVVGAKAYIDRLKKNPLARVLRLDKMTIAALEATLRLYLDEEEARREIPTLAMLSANADAVRARACALKKAIDAAVPAGCCRTTVADDIARAGGGALPMCDIPTSVVCVEFLRGSAQECEAYLVSERDVPVVCRIRSERILCDALTLLGDGEATEVAQGLREYFEREAHAAGA